MLGVRSGPVKLLRVMKDTGISLTDLADISLLQGQMQCPSPTRAIGEVALCSI